jgi:hypothetical protein
MIDRKLMAPAALLSVLLLLTSLVSMLPALSTGVPQSPWLLAAFVLGGPFSTWAVGTPVFVAMVSMETQPLKSTYALWWTSMALAFLGLLPLIMFLLTMIDQLQFQMVAEFWKLWPNFAYLIAFMVGRLCRYEGVRRWDSLAPKWLQVRAPWSEFKAACRCLSVVAIIKATEMAWLGDDSIFGVVIIVSLLVLLAITLWVTSRAKNLYGSVWPQFSTSDLFAAALIFALLFALFNFRRSQTTDDTSQAASTGVAIDHWQTPDHQTDNSPAPKDSLRGIDSSLSC